MRSKTGLNLAFSKPQVIIHTVATYKINSVINGQEFFLIRFVVVVVFLGPHLRHMEVPRLEVESEL